jgi:hypothetical protein
VGCVGTEVGRCLSVSFGCLVVGVGIVVLTLVGCVRLEAEDVGGEEGKHTGLGGRGEGYLYLRSRQFKRLGESQFLARGLPPAAIDLSGDGVT